MGENKLVYCDRLLPLNMKSVNPIQKHLHIIESYSCIIWIFVVKFLFQIYFLISFGICYQFMPHIIIKKQWNPMSSYRFILIKIFYICPILYFIPAKLIFCIAFGSATSLSSLFKSIAINLYYFLKFVVLARYMFHLIVLLKLDSNCSRIFMLSWIDKVTTGT